MLAGKEYGSGSSRDWAAKGTALLGVRAVIAESYERIHRSNLIGMGVLPLQYQDGQNAASLGLTGEEVFTIEGIAAGDSVPRELTVRAGRHVVPGHGAHRHARGAGVLPQRRDHAVRAALAALTTGPTGARLPRGAGRRRPDVQQPVQDPAEPNRGDTGEVRPRPAGGRARARPRRGRQPRAVPQRGCASRT